MKLQLNYFCHSGRNTRRQPRIRKGDVKACYVWIRQRWVGVGTLCLDCAEFVSEL